MKQLLIAVAAFGLGLFAQTAQIPDKKVQYFCSVGKPMWVDMMKQRPTAEKTEAEKICAEKYRQEVAEQKIRDAEAQKALRELVDAEQELAKLKQQDAERRQFLCSIRTHYLDGRKDDPKCAGIPPDIKSLQLAHKVCAGVGDCDRLLPLSMGRAYPERTPAKKQ